MKCPVCKKEIKTDVLKCPHCNARIGIPCKNCRTVNLVGRKVCKNCGNELLKFCPSCKAANVPDAVKCRKCGEIFNKEAKIDDLIKTEDKIQYNNTEKKATVLENEPDVDKEPAIQTVKNMQFAQNKQIKYSQKSLKAGGEKSEPNIAKLSQNEAKELIEKALADEKKHVISLSGSRGAGKSLVVKSVMHDTKETSNLMWLFVECTPISQLTTGGFLQNLLLDIFNLPAMCIHSPQFQQSAYEFIKKNFETLDDNEIFDLINFLYPNTRGNYEDIPDNKLRTFSMLEKVFDKITAGVRAVFAIDNFQYADGFSYEFLIQYLKNEDVYQKTKVILTYEVFNPVKGKFYLADKQNEDYTADFVLAPFEYTEMLQILVNKKKINSEIPGLTKQEAHQIWGLSKANPAYIEQTFALKADCKMANQPFEVSENFNGIVSQRLALLSYLNTRMYNFILTSAILGKKINVALVKEILSIPDEEIKGIVEFLTEHDYIRQYSEIYYEFKSSYLWEAIMTCIKLDENFTPANERILDFLRGYTLNTVSVLAIIAQNLKQINLAMDIWTKVVHFCAYIGDINLYIVAQKQCMAIINEFDDKETLKIRYNISERLGKLLTDLKPEEAMEYLPDAIYNAKSIDNEPKEIELLGYMSSCCRKTGNYNGEIECTDAVIERAKDKLTNLNLVLLKCTKLEALLNIGNCGEVVNTIDNEIMPVLDNFFSTKYDIADLRVKFVFETWVKTYLVLAKALILQGNNRSFQVLKILYDIIDNNKIEDNEFICKSKLALAFANTVKGDYKVSEQILNDVSKEFPYGFMDDDSVIKWNFIDIINKFLTKRYYGMQENLFKVVTFANNNGDNFVKNILKVLLGKLFKDSNNIDKAVEIYNEQIVYFAKEKMAFGALLTWFMIADASIVKEGAKNAINIANQALDVAQNPKIQNFYFEVLLKIVLIKSFILLEDFESAKMHLDSAIKIAKEFEMTDLLSRLYLLHGNCYRELGLVNSPKQKQYISGAKKMYENSIELSEINKNAYIYQEAEHAIDALNEFCKINKI